MSTKRRVFPKEFRQQMVELGRLRRENRRLREEREILKKAAAWFARETESKSSDS